MIRLQPFGNTGHGPVPRRRWNESEQETGSPNDPGMIDDFPSGGHADAAVWVNTLQRPGYSPGWCTLLTTTTLLSQRAEHSRLWLETFPKHLIRRGTTRIFRVLCDKAKRGCASRVPPSPGAAARRTRGVLVVGATPLFWPLMRHGAGAGYSCLYSSFSLPLGVAPTTVIPAGRLQ